MLVGTSKQKGFTIVELLIVVVVIAILAAISIVAYSGIQDRAKYAKALSDLQAINKAINMYQAQNGTFPIVTSWRYSCSYPSNPNDFIPDLAEVMPNTPAAPCNGGVASNDSWIYRSDATGTNYKLLYIRANVSESFRNQVPSSMQDPPRWSAGTTWGYWTSGYAST